MRMGTYSMLNKITELNDELLDLKELIIRNQTELLKEQEKKFQHVDKIYADKVLMEKIKHHAHQADKNSGKSVRQVEKALESVEKLKQDINKIIKEYEAEFDKTINNINSNAKKQNKNFGEESVKHFEKLDEKIRGFNVDNADFKNGLKNTFKKLEGETLKSINIIKKINRKFGTDVTRKVDNINAFTVEKLREFYEGNKTNEKYMQEQIFKIDEHVRELFAKEKQSLNEYLNRMVEVINQFYELYYSKVSKDELRVYQRAIDELEKRIEQLEIRSGAQYENL